MPENNEMRIFPPQDRCGGGGTFFCLPQDSIYRHKNAWILRACFYEFGQKCICHPCDAHANWTIEEFRYPKVPSCLFPVNFPLPTLTPKQLLVWMLSRQVSCNCPWAPWNGIIRDVLFGVWFLSLSIMFWRIMHDMHISVTLFFLWPSGAPLFVYPFTAK